MKVSYYPSLDFFRGFCGYGVAVTHLYAFVFNSTIMEYISILFVEFFFVLSGFVLYPQLIKVKNNKKNLLIFYKRRWIRTLPLYLIVILLVSILTKNLFTYDFLKYLFFIQKFYPGFLTQDYYPVAWSLAIEELFYIFFPILLIYLNKKNFIQLLVNFFLMYLCLKFLFLSNFNLDFYRTGTILRIDAIFVGFIVAHFRNFFLHYYKIIFFLLFSLLFAYFFFKSFFLQSSEINFIKFLFIVLLQIISAFALIFFLKINKFFTNPKLNKFALLISQQTYSVYLMHIILIYIIKNYNFSIIFSNIFYISFLAVFSSLVYNYIEKPLLKIRPKMP